MTGQRETTRYATPGFTQEDQRWAVWAGIQRVGWIYPSGPIGWTAQTSAYHYAGLWPTKQAAAEVLVKQAGYELEVS